VLNQRDKISRISATTSRKNIASTSRENSQNAKKAVQSRHSEGGKADRRIPCMAMAEKVKFAFS